MTNYREILRLSAMGFSQQNIAYSCNASKKTVNRVPRKPEKTIFHCLLIMTRQMLYWQRYCFLQMRQKHNGTQKLDY